MDSTTIADALAWYMAKTPDPYGRRRKKAGRLFTADSLGEITGINPVTIATFLNKKKRPHERTVEVIRSYLEQEGALREYMAEVMNPVRPPQSLPTEPEMLAEIGIKSTSKHYLCAQLSDWQFALFIKAMMTLPEDQARELLKLLCAQSFPDL